MITEQTREKMRLAKLKNPVKYWAGKKKSKSHLKKLGESFKKVWENPEYRKHMSTVHLGQKAWNKNTKGIMKPNKTSFKKGQNTGPENNRWRGGITSENSKIRSSLEYKAWRYDIFKRDWFTCKMPGCGYKGKDIEAHHVRRVKDFPELLLELTNGITLCKKCHLRTRNKENVFEALFNQIITVVTGQRIQYRE